MSAHDPFDPYSESIRALRTELLLRAPEDGCNVLAIVSAGAGEGRSRLAAELAVAFSQLGQATLLVDCDLRRPSQHELFGAENDRGLTDALHQGRTTRLQTVVGLPGLALLTAGPKANTPLEMLSAPVFGEMLHGWRRRYRHILLDTPAVTDFSDGLAVATHATRVLAVSRKHHSRLSDARDMLRRLNSARAQIVGAVINEF
jgi:receptor protein-tyrosine kinase